MACPSLGRAAHQSAYRLEYFMIIIACESIDEQRRVSVFTGCTVHCIIYKCTIHSTKFAVKRSAVRVA